MARELIRLRVRRGSNLASVADTVHADKTPRVLERDGEAVAAIVSIDDLNRLLLEGPPPGGVARALSAAGAWDEVDSEELIERIYKARHKSLPSQPT